MELIIDLGTTNITVSLSQDGLLSDFRTYPNKQIKYGRDILTRLKQEREMMHQLITNELRKIIHEYENRHSQACNSIVVVGNSIMNSFLLNIDFPSLKKFYKNNFRILNGRELGLDEVEVWLPPIMERFVGSDALAVLAGAGILESDRNIMVVDLGTNGEVIFGNKEKIFFSSFAAGPAFEGQSISCGSTEKKGAIVSASIEDKLLKVKTLGNTRPTSICATGLIDLVACLRELNTISESGSIEKERIDLADNVYLTRLDIREIQKSKSACLTSILCLTKKTNLEIDELILTGVFGSFINIKNAVSMGLLPDIPVYKYKINRHLVNWGAEKIRRKPERYLPNLFSKVEYVALETEPYFINSFIKNLSFKKYNA